MHKFKIGQTVQMIPANYRRGAASGYKIIQHLPDANGELHYRIRSASEPHERVVKESELKSD
jgi:hypothetical protein